MIWNNARLMVSQSSPQLKRRPGPLAPLGQLGQGLGQGLAYSCKGRTLGSEFDQALSEAWQANLTNSEQNSKNNAGCRVMSPARLLLLQKLLEDSCNLSHHQIARYQGYQVQHNMLESLTEKMGWFTITTSSRMCPWMSMDLQLRLSDPDVTHVTLNGCFKGKSTGNPHI